MTGIIGDMSNPATPAPNKGSINNQTSAIVSPTTNNSGLNHFGPQSEGAIPANNIDNKIPLL